MGKLCMIYNFAPHYREAIFRLIDAEYDCDWFFGDHVSNIKGMDLSALKRAAIVHTCTFVRRPLYWQRGVVPLLFKKEYHTYFMLGELYCVSTWVVLVLRKLLFPEKRVYLWSHAWYGREGRLKAWLKKRFFRLAEGTFVYGDYAKRLMLREGFDESRLFVIHNSLSYDRQLSIRQQLQPTPLYKAHFNNSVPNLVFIGRLTQEKRIDWLLAALALLKKDGCLCNLTLVGAGEQEDVLRALVEEKGLAGQVWFYGACYDEERNAELLYNADLCVSPGNVGLTAIHSMMFGTPVATHDTFKFQGPEFEAIHEGLTGTFFEYASPLSIAEKVMAWLSSHEGKREEVRRACYAEIDRYWTPQYQIKVIKDHLKVD